jgi:hypothetical protein
MIRKRSIVDAIITSRTVVVGKEKRSPPEEDCLKVREDVPVILLLIPRLAHRKKDMNVKESERRSVIVRRNNITSSMKRRIPGVVIA